MEKLKLQPGFLDLFNLEPTKILHVTNTTERNWLKALMRNLGIKRPNIVSHCITLEMIKENSSENVKHTQSHTNVILQGQLVLRFISLITSLYCPKCY